MMRYWFVVDLSYESIRVRVVGANPHSQSVFVEPEARTGFMRQLVPYDVLVLWRPLTVRARYFQETLRAQLAADILRRRAP